MTHGTDTARIVPRDMWLLADHENFYSSLVREQEPPEHIRPDRIDAVSASQGYPEQIFSTVLKCSSVLVKHFSLFGQPTVCLHSNVALH